MLNTQTAKQANVKIWQKPHEKGEHLSETMQISLDVTWIIYSLTEKAGYEETDQVPGWELYLFDFKSERAAFMEGMDRIRPMGPVPHIKDTLMINGETKQALFIAFEEFGDYVDLIESIGGEEGDLIVHTYTETK